MCKLFLECASTAKLNRRRRAQMQQRCVLINRGRRLGAAVALGAAEIEGSDTVLAEGAGERGAAVQRLGCVISHKFYYSPFSPPRSGQWVWDFGVGNILPPAVRSRTASAFNNRAGSFGFDSDLHRRPGLEAYLVSILVVERVFNSDLGKEIIGAFDCNLCFFWFARVRELNNFGYRAGQFDAGLLALHISITNLNSAPSLSKRTHFVASSCHGEREFLASLM